MKIAILPKRTLNYIANGASDGHRHMELLAAACQFRDFGEPLSRALSVLGARAEADGLSEKEYTSVINGVYGYAKRDPVMVESDEPGQGIVVEKKRRTPEDIERDRQRHRNAVLRRKAEVILKTLYADFPASPEDFFHSSPVPLICGESHYDWRLLLQLFVSDDVVWIGRGCGDSASEAHDTAWINYCKSRFRTVSEWLKEKEPPGMFTCPSTFKPGVSSRSNANVLLRQFLVIESDSLSKSQMCSVIRWMQITCRLRAIVDTAGKSLHGWFDVPHGTSLDELLIMLPVLGCDPSLFKPSQPCRLPGAMRDDKKKRQALLYLDLEDLK